MFLNELSRKTKESFWELANLLVAADNVVLDEEKVMLEQYRVEMQLDLDAGKNYRTSKEIVQDLAEETISTQRIIFLELLGLAYVDKCIAPEESKVLEELQDAFAITSEKRMELMNCVEDVIQLYARIKNAILEV